MVKGKRQCLVKVAHLTWIRPEFFFLYLGQTQEAKNDVFIFQRKVNLQENLAISSLSP
jgi:hypothetical protein